MKLIEYEINKHMEGRDLGLAFSANASVSQSNVMRASPFFKVNPTTNERKTPCQTN